jgi:hypothetical protein
MQCSLVRAVGAQFQGLGETRVTIVVDIDEFSCVRGAIRTIYERGTAREERDEE